MFVLARHDISDTGHSLKLHHLQYVATTDPMSKTYYYRTRYIPHRPWARVGANLFELNNQPYLILVDYYSGFIEVNLLQGTTSKQIITYCKSQFSHHGILDTLS